MSFPFDLDILAQLTRIADALERAAPATRAAKNTPPLPAMLAPMTDGWMAWNGQRPIWAPGNIHDIIQRNGVTLHDHPYRNSYETTWLWWARAAKGEIRPTDVIAFRFHRLDSPDQPDGR